ncbi:hypothetical protein [Haloarcula sp. CBA1127]|uniref:hypothetical protein n=1 Tax=Haloarcula sp. CBA1127 TaxID=1765055 RepID=UPI00073E94A4|nr:hypothetical protein [Haloarcula sp. CBA1127]
MISASLSLEIHEIHPSAVYEETVYTQDAVVSLADSTHFEIYDHRALLTSEHVGMSLSIELFVFLANVAEFDASERRVTFDRESQPVFQGQVTEIDRDTNTSRGILDVGVGTILFDPSEAENTLEVDDWVQISRNIRYLETLH